MELLCWLKNVNLVLTLREEESRWTKGKWTFDFDVGGITSFLRKFSSDKLNTCSSRECYKNDVHLISYDVHR